MNATCVNMLKICNVNPMMSMHAYICVEYFASICRIYNLILQTYIKPCFYIIISPPKKSFSRRSNVCSILCYSHMHVPCEMLFDI